RVRARERDLGVVAGEVAAVGERHLEPVLVGGGGQIARLDHRRVADVDGSDVRGRGARRAVAVRSTARAGAGDAGGSRLGAVGGGAAVRVRDARVTGRADLVATRACAR